MTGSPHSRDSFSSPLQVSLVIIEGRPRRLRLVLIRLKTRWGGGGGGGGWPRKTSVVVGQPLKHQSFPGLSHSPHSYS